MGRTIRTIIVLLAAVMLLAGCDPKMGNQGGFGAQGGEETQGGITINGITFPPREENIQFEENPSPETMELLKYCKWTELDLCEGVANFVTDDTAGMPDTDIATWENWASKMVVTHDKSDALHFYLREGETCTVTVERDGLTKADMLITKFEFSSAENQETHRIYTSLTFVKDGTSHIFQDNDDQIKLDAAYYDVDMSDL